VAEQGKRVIVDGVEFRRVCLFPRILNEVAAAMQPARMIIALFMVVLLIAVGRTWDRVTEANVSPRGLLHGRVTWEERAAHQEALVAGVLAFANEHAQGGDPSKWSSLKTRQVKAWVVEGHLKKRGEMKTDEEREPIDNTYVAIMRQIEETRPLGDFEATVDHAAASFRGVLVGVYHLSIAETLSGLDLLFVQTAKALARDQRWFGVFFGLACLIVGAVMFRRNRKYTGLGLVGGWLVGLLLLVFLIQLQ